jgi:putative transposase
MESNKDLPSRRSVRLPEFDYAKVGMYFVTICAFERRCIFGEICGNKTVLSPIGQIISACWIEIPQHFPHAKIETYVVMPNHLHGIVTIHSKRVDANPQAKTATAIESIGKPTPGSIPTIIRSFKAAASKRARESEYAKVESIWQRGYYEHVLRNTKEYVEITNYILQNSARWADDEDNPNRKLRVDNL